MNKRKQYYGAGPIIDAQQKAGVLPTQVGSNAKQSLLNFANSVVDTLANPAVLAGQQGIATNINKPPKEKPAQLPNYQVASPRPVDRMSAGTTGAMAVQRMASGVGAHPGGAGRGKGAGGSLGQESRQAMKRKRLSKRIANRKVKGKDKIKLSKDAPKQRDDQDYAEGGRVGYEEGKMVEKNTWKKTGIEKMRYAYEEGGEAIEDQMGDLMMMPEEEQVMVPDEQMEDDYTDFIIGESLTPEDEEYLLTALEQDDRLSMIFDQVVDTASEFSGSGPVEGPGTGMSDSIPARLSDGEFVLTSKATEEIGPDKLQGMMEQAEMDADARQIRQAGGYVTETEEEQEEQEIVRAVQPKETQGRLMPRSLADKKVNESMIALNPRNSLFAT